MSRKAAFIIGKMGLKESLRHVRDSFHIKGLKKNKSHYLPEAILERDKERRASRIQCDTQAVSDAAAAQKHPGPLGSPIFGSWQRCSSVMCRRGHTALVAPYTDLKAGTPNSKSYSFSTPKQGRPL